MVAVTVLTLIVPTLWGLGWAMSVLSFFAPEEIGAWLARTSPLCVGVGAVAASMAAALRGETVRAVIGAVIAGGYLWWWWRKRPPRRRRASRVHALVRVVHGRLRVVQLPAEVGA